jgi:hypothetical protein
MILIKMSIALVILTARDFGWIVIESKRSVSSEASATLCGIPSELIGSWTRNRHEVVSKLRIR